jgi:hypothetical protein
MEAKLTPPTSRMSNEAGADDGSGSGLTTSCAGSDTAGWRSL